MEREKAISVALWQKGGSDEEQMTFAEIKSLAETAGVEVVESFVQPRSEPDRRYYIGPGKAQEIADYAKAHDISTFIFDGELSPSQVHNLEAIITGKIIDRSELILDIFARRAASKEGKLQVELAQLKYQLPKLSGRGRDLSRLAGGIGTRGPGETKLETDRRRIRQRITNLEREIAEMGKHRELLRSQRQKRGVFQVALVGYTNSGKSTLLNRLTDAGTYADDLLFATLDPLSRRLATPVGTIVLTDTVGFITGLPHHLIAAFRATLEAALHADLLVHVVDVSQPKVGLRLDMVNKVLKDLGAQEKDQLVAANKVDHPDAPANLDSLFRSGPEYVAISALTGENTDKLLEKIIQFMEPRTLFRANLPMDLFRRLSRNRPGDIRALEFNEDTVLVEANLPRHLAETMEKYRSLETD